MMKPTRPNYQPLQKVILFGYEYSRDGGPVIGWVILPVVRPPWPIWYIGRTESGQWTVKVSSDEEDAIMGRGSEHRADRMRPCTPEFWATCEEWRRRGKQLQADLVQMERGKVPTDYVKTSLFEVA